MITVTLTMPLKPGVLAEFTPVIADLIKETAARPGFKSIRILRHQDADDRVIFIETWENAASYEAYLGWRAQQNSRTAIAPYLAGVPTSEIWSDEIASEGVLIPG